MGYLTKSVLKIKRKNPPTLGSREHAVQLKRIEIENYKRCYTDIHLQAETRQTRYRLYLEKLEAELAELEQAVALHPQSGAL